MFSVKGHIINMLGVVGHMTSVRTTQLYHFSAEVCPKKPEPERCPQGKSSVYAQYALEKRNAGS